MAEHQRVHPADVESPAGPTVPLVPAGARKSEFPGGDTPVRSYQPLRRKKRSCCCRFLCCAVCFFIVFIAIIAALAGVFYLVFQPKLPKYSLTNLSVRQFNVTDGSTLSSSLDAEVVARNPNKRIGIYYEGGSHIGVWYESAKICEGSFPKFYQGHKNTTVLELPLTGTINDAAGLLSTIQETQTSNGAIELKVKVKQPVRIKVGTLKLMKMKFRVTCNLRISQLVVGKTINFQNTNCKIRFKF